jgi:hypothetical protein
MELNEDTVLAAVNDLHARTGKRVLTLIEIAEAIEGQRFDRLASQRRGRCDPMVAGVLPSRTRRR